MSAEEEFEKIKAGEAKTIILRQQMRILELKVQLEKTERTLDRHMTYINKQGDKLAKVEKFAEEHTERNGGLMDLLKEILK